MTPKQLVLACDLGGSSFRAALIDMQGNSVAQATVALHAPLDAQGHSQTNPDQWWQALQDCVGELSSRPGHPLAHVAGVAICGFTRTQVLLDRGGVPIHDALLWNDTRAEAHAQQLRSRLGAAGKDISAVNAFHPLARLLWLNHHVPSIRERLHCILEPKDYLNLRLCGAWASDRVSMTPLTHLLAQLNLLPPDASFALPRMPLPELHAPVSCLGRVGTSLSGALKLLADVPVFCCSHDSWASAVGLGALQAGRAYNLSGTTEVFGLMTNHDTPGDGLLSVDWDGLFHIGGPSQNGAATIGWFTSLLGTTAGVAPDIEALLNGPRDPQPLLFLPYLQGERVPHWNPRLRGAFIGLHSQHSTTDLAYAVLEGIACATRDVLGRAEQLSNVRAQEVRFGGGGAANRRWCQIKADVCNRPFTVGAAAEPGLLGAAITAWVGLGRFADLPSAQDALVQIAARHLPDPTQALQYDRLFALFQQGQAALAPISSALANLSALSPKPDPVSCPNS